MTNYLDTLRSERQNWFDQAVHYARRGLDENRVYCQGRAAGIDSAIVLLGGEGENLSIGDAVRMAADVKRVMTENAQPKERNA